MIKRHFKGKGTYEEESDSSEEEELNHSEQQMLDELDSDKKSSSGVQVQVRIGTQKNAITTTHSAVSRPAILKTHKPEYDSDHDSEAESKRIDAQEDNISSSGSGSSSSEEDSSDEEDESSEDEYVMKKPVFISKSKRKIEHNSEMKLGNIEDEQKEKLIALKEIEQNLNRVEEEDRQRKIEESWTMEENTKGLNDVDLEEEQEAEYKLWKQRELARLRRDRELLISKEKERDEIEERRKRSKE